MKRKVSKSSDDLEEHSIGVWILSYADMMSLLLCFFMILHSLNHVDDQRIEDITKQLSEAFKGEYKEIEKRPRDSIIEFTDEVKIQTFDKLVATTELGSGGTIVLRNLKSIADQFIKGSKADEIIADDLSQLLKSHALYLTQEQLTSRIVLPSSLLFERGSYKLKDKGSFELTSIVRTLEKVQDLVSIEIVGHSGIRNSKTKSKNSTSFYLSSQQAASVADFIDSHSKKKMGLRVFGMGSTEPLIAPEISEKFGNRKFNLGEGRIEIIIRKMKYEENL